MRRIIARIMSNVPSQVQQTMQLIEPMVNERFEKMDKLGKAWEDPPVRDPDPILNFIVYEVGKQCDILMWLMSEAKGVERSLEGLARRLLLINFAFIHTTPLVRPCLAWKLCSLI